MGFSKATRKQAKLRLALSGPSGSGKTTGALMIAEGLGGRIAVIDTERGSASLYATQFDFDVMELAPDYTPEKYIEAINLAEKAGYDILIIDSMSHEWNGQGGCLELNDSIARSKYRGNTWSAWNEITPRHRKFVDAILASPMHIICTMRSKTDTIQTENERGKKVVQKVGMKSEQRDGMDYEFTTVLDLSVDGNIAVASKDRTNLFRDPFVISASTGERLRDWLNTGEEVNVKSRPAEHVEQVQKPQAEDLSQENAQAVARFRQWLREGGYLDNKDSCLAMLSDFCGRNITSTKDITPEEAARILVAQSQATPSEFPTLIPAVDPTNF